VLHEVFQKTRVTDRGNAMFDAFRTETDQGVPDAFGTGGLTGMRHAPQSGRASPIELITKHRAGKAAVRPTESEPDQSRDVVIKRDRCGQLGGWNSEVRRYIENPPKL
jgi:hypothetical protein